ncbi:hypothetical protein [Chitinivorax sp. B]|uniref:hypothetical protein n=1 Tax=Chitinivorax sp. B TaxID=2502235 RepID=UPI0010F5279E|nr:hypothetical protein [Chitinivorax sp. B]
MIISHPPLRFSCLLALCSLYTATSHAGMHFESAKLKWKPLNYQVKGYNGNWCIQPYLSGDILDTSLKRCNNDSVQFAHTAAGQVIARFKDNADKSHFWCLSTRPPNPGSYEYLAMDYCDLNDAKQRWKFVYSKTERAYQLVNDLAGRRVEGGASYPYVSDRDGNAPLLLPVDQYADWISRPSSPLIEFSTDIRAEGYDISPTAGGWLYQQSYPFKLHYNAHNGTLSLAYYNGARHGRKVCLKSNQANTVSEWDWVTNEYCSTDGDAPGSMQWTLHGETNGKVSIRDGAGNELRVQQSFGRGKYYLYTSQKKPANDSAHIRAFQTNALTHQAALFTDQVCNSQRTHRVPRAADASCGSDGRYLAFNVAANILYLSATQLQSRLPTIQDVIGHFYSSQLVPLTGENRYLDALYDLVRNHPTYSYQLLTSRYFNRTPQTPVTVTNNTFSQVYNVNGDVDLLKFGAVFDHFMERQIDQADPTAAQDASRFFWRTREVYGMTSGRSLGRNMALFHFTPRPDPQQPNTQPPAVFIMALSGGSTPNDLGELRLHIGVESSTGSVHPMPIQWPDTSDNHTNPTNRFADSERMAFEYMLTNREIDTLLSRGGVLRILSERPLCAGCQTATAEFMSRYQNVHVRIVHGAGKTQKP